MKRLVMDLDNTISVTTDGDYANAEPRADVIAQMRRYQADGFEIVISTARNMRSFEGNVGKIQMHTVPIIMEWLERHDVPCDGLLIGKPWCGHDGFYVDDRAIRPDEFTAMDYAAIKTLLET
ncbi:MAG: capsular biosynthesis protein [Pseudomonadota bacterium]